MDELAVLERLVRRYSPSGHEGPAVREFVRIARALGYAAHVDAAGNGVARRGTGIPRIDFWGHIDTVDGVRPVIRRRGRLSGRGTVDAKGPLTAALLAGSEVSGPGEFRVVAAVGEESDSRGARHLVRSSPPAALIAGEPSGWDGVTIGYKGMLRLEAHFRGARTHRSSPSPTPGDRAVEWASAVRRCIEGARGATGFTSPTAKIVELTSWTDAGSESARVEVDLRLPPSLSSAAALARLPVVGRGASLRVPVRIEPAEVDRSNPVVRGLLAGIRAEGGRPTLWRKGGTSDLNLAVGAWGIPAAAYGPGDSRLDHTERESMSGRELARSVRVLRTALERIRSDLAGTTPRRSADGA